MHEIDKVNLRSNDENFDKIQHQKDEIENLKRIINNQANEYNDLKEKYNQFLVKAGLLMGFTIKSAEMESMMKNAIGN